MRDAARCRVHGGGGARLVGNAGARQHAGDFLAPVGFAQLVLELVRLLACPGETMLVFLPGIAEISELYEALSVLEKAPSEQYAAGLGPRATACMYKVFALHSTIPMEEQQEASAQRQDRTRLGTDLPPHQMYRFTGRSPDKLR